MIKTPRPLAHHAPSVPNRSSSMTVFVPQWHLTVSRHTRLSRGHPGVQALHHRLRQWWARWFGFATKRVATPPQVQFLANGIEGLLGLPEPN